MAITIPELNNVNTLDDTDSIMLTHSNGNSEKISGAAFKSDLIKNKIENNNGNAVSVNAVSTIMATSTTITGPELGAGGNIKILFTSAIAGVDTSTGLILTYNGSPIAVKVGKNGALVDFCAYEDSTGVYEYLQAYTTLEMVYDGTQFIIIGNPVVLSDAQYIIYSDGNHAVNEVTINNMRSVTSNAVAAIFGGTPSVTNVSTSNFSGKVLAFPGGLKILCGLVSWQADNGTTSFGSATICYSTQNVSFPAAFNVSAIISAQASPFDTGSGVPGASVESLSDNSIDVCDYGYAGTTASSTRDHRVFISVMGI